MNLGMSTKDIKRDLLNKGFYGKNPVDQERRVIMESWKSINTHKFYCNSTKEKKQEQDEYDAWCIGLIEEYENAGVIKELAKDGWITS